MITRVPGSAAAVIEPVCALFRRQILLDPDTRLEPYLSRIGPEHRQTLLAELVEIELSSRTGRSERPQLDEYHSRFPGDGALVEAAWRRIVAAASGDQRPDAWATVGPVQPAPDLRRLGDYELLEKIGAGGMGVVYRARQTRLGQVVALKVLPDQCLHDSRAVSRFEREMQAVGTLDHPNIVKALNAGEDHGTHFLVMEFIDGVPLDALVARAAPVPVGAACELIRQAALGLEHAHARGLVHRDIKPGNMILSRQGTLKILDMGLARFLQDDRASQLTHSGSAMGTPDFMAPEQGEDAGAADIRADIYSLGCTLYYLLAGSPPYSGPQCDTYKKKIVAHAVAPLPSLAVVRPDCPEDVQRILFHMMAKDPDERFDTPGEVVDAIALFADAAAVAALQDAVGLPVQCRTPMRLGLLASEQDTAPRPGRGTTKPLSRRPGSRPVVRAGIAALLLAGVTLGVAALRWMRTVDPVRLRHATEICVLPGLNGDWWFDEMPRFVPFVRAAIAAEVRTGAALGRESAGSGSGANPALDPRGGEDWLVERMDAVASRPVFTPAQRTLMERLERFSRPTESGDALPAALREACDAFAGALDTGSAADLHTLAVLRHALAQSERNSAAAALALEDYERARAAYDRSDATHDGLRRLCLLDEGWCRAQFDDDLKAMTACFEQALEGTDDPFVVAQVLATQGKAACVKDRYGEGDHAYEQAAVALEKSSLPAGHPLVASLAERHAFSLLYQWKAAEAEKLFEKAISVRSLLMEHEHSRVERLFLLHARHGLAMAYRYRGQATDSRSEFDKVLRDVALRDTLGNGDSAAATRGATPLWRKQLERAFNSRERRADCELYGGAGSWAKAPDIDLGQACRLYREAHDLAAATPVFQLVVAYKLSVALALDGQVSQAREWLSRADDLYGQTNREADRRRIDVLREVARATVAMGDGTSAADGRRRLQELLDDLVNPEARDRCEVQELHLLAAEILLASSLRSGDSESAARDARHLGLAMQRILDAFRDVDTEDELRRDLRPYMRRLCEIMVEAELPDAKRVAHVVRFSRHHTPDSRPEASLLFFFQDHHVGHRANIALLETAEDGWKLFDLGDVSREAVLDGRVATPLPVDLVARCRALAAAGVTPEISWSDAACWADPARAITDKHWPAAWGAALGFSPEPP